MQEYIREKYRHFFGDMQTKDNKYFYKEILEEEYEEIKTVFNHKENRSDFVKRGSNEHGDYKTLKFMRLNCIYKFAVLPEVVAILVKIEPFYVEDKGSKKYLFIARTEKQSLFGKYLKGYLERKINVLGGPSDLFSGYIPELYPVLIKADTMRKEGFIPLFDVEKEESFERLYPYMEIRYEKPTWETVIQEKYQQFLLFSNYEIIENNWQQFINEGNVKAKALEDIVLAHAKTL